MPKLGPSSTFNQCAKVHLAHLKLRNFSPASIGSRRYTFIRFERYLSNLKLQSHPATWDLSCIQSWSTKLTNSYSKSYAYHSLNDIKQFVAHMEEEDVIAPPISINILVPKYPAGKPRPLSLSDVKAYLNSFNFESHIDSRNRAIAEATFGMGLRTGEVCRAKKADLFIDDFSKVMLRVQGKGSKERVVPTTIEFLAALEHYLRINPHRRDSPYLFCTKYRDQIQSGQVQVEARKASKRLNLQTMTAVRMRHTFATECLRNGMSIRILQELLGHDNLCTTAIYTGVSAADESHAVKLLLGRSRLQVKRPPSFRSEPKHETRH